MQDLSPEFKEAARKWPAHRWKTFDQGCATTLVAALDPELAGELSVSRGSEVGLTSNDI